MGHDGAASPFLRLPDFVIIGAMKCGTTSLHAQLARQPGIFMSSPKELQFFSHDEHWTQGLTSYSSMFESAAPGDLTGEATPHYTMRPQRAATVARMAQTFDEDTRFIYMMRNPIERSVSHYYHQWSRRRIATDLDTALLSESELLAYSRYAYQLEPYLDAFGPERVLPVFLEALSARPDEQFARICDFLGYEGSPSWMPELILNRTVELPRPNRVRELLVNLPAARAAWRALIPQQLRHRSLAPLEIGETLTPSGATVRRLAECFDRDLEVLGGWLGVELSCATYGRAVELPDPQWS